MARPLVGLRLRQHRRQLGLTQAALAAQVGISASYLNLIEHGKRDVAGSLLRRLAEALQLDLAEVAGQETTRLVQDLTEVTVDPLLRDLLLDQAGAQEIVGRRPEWGRAAVRLHRSYRRASLLAETLSDRLAHDAALIEASHELRTRIAAIRSFAEILQEHPDIEPERRVRFTSLLAGESARLCDIAEVLFDRLGRGGESGRPTTPAEEVDDFIIDHGNYFPDLEERAAAIMAEPGTPGLPAEAVLARRLADRHGIRIETGALDLPGGPAARRGAFDPDCRLFRAPAGMPGPTLRFALARLVFSYEAEDAVRALIHDPRLRSEAARSRAAGALHSYGAGAMLFPYRSFIEAAERVRYDIDRLAGLFGASIEQVCHRLVTLRRPGAEGVPFAFLRVDPAGNISKRFSLPVLRLPRHGGACPLWAVYTALRSPASPVTQRVRLSEGREFLFVARTVSKPPAGFGHPGETYGLMIGCEAVYAERTVYGDAFRGANGLTLETGINCHLCTREDCPQRAFPPVLARPSTGH